MNQDQLSSLCKLIRYYILRATTEAGSGHATSSLSAVELMAGLMFGGFFRYDLDNPKYPNNDRLIFSKGHASPLFYALWAAAGKVSEDELIKMRQFDSTLEGHPTKRFPLTEVATGSLGQGLSVGVGMAINAQYLDHLPYRTFVLLGDSEMAEGSVWEAMQIAAHYKLNQLIGILDVNRLGQRGETMYGYDLAAYEKRVSAFGWKAIVIADGHDLQQVSNAYEQALSSADQPTMLIAKTVKGKGVALLEDQDGWHGRAPDSEQFKQALSELGEIDYKIKGQVAKPEKKDADANNQILDKPLKTYAIGEEVATRKAYGEALVDIYPDYPNMVVLDAEVSNSTYASIFAKANPERFFEMYIAEQNMIGTALGLSVRGKIPFVSTFAAFLTRAIDQIRMAANSGANIKLVGSHAGVSVGADGPSQMGLEDLAIFRSIFGSVVFYPADAVATQKLVEIMAKEQGLFYLRTTRDKTPVIYDSKTSFKIGGSSVLKSSEHDTATIASAGITLYEALSAYERLKTEGITVRVIDLYSVKPLDVATLKTAALQTQAIITVEDHYITGGLGEAVCAALADKNVPIYVMAVEKMPQSGKPEVLMDYEHINAAAICDKIKEVINKGASYGKESK